LFRPVPPKTTALISSDYRCIEIVKYFSTPPPPQERLLNPPPSQERLLPPPPSREATQPSPFKRGYSTLPLLKRGYLFYKAIF
jgi:hypothetical protein